MKNPILSPEGWAIVEARSHDPFAWLGRHYHSEGGIIVRANKPRAEKVWLLPASGGPIAMDRVEGTDRKSTRLNSSHRCISYAVFCLKKKIQKSKN